MVTAYSMMIFDGWCVENSEVEVALKQIAGAAEGNASRSLDEEGKSAATSACYDRPCHIHFRRWKGTKRVRYYEIRYLELSCDTCGSRLHLGLTTAEVFACYTCVRVIFILPSHLALPLSTLPLTQYFKSSSKHFPRTSS